MPDEVDKGPDAAAAAPSKPAKGSRKKLTWLVSVVVLLGGAGAAAWYAGVLPIGRRHGRHAQATAAVEGEAGGEGGAAADGDADREASAEDAHAGRATRDRSGATLPLETFIANLADDGGKRYLKTTMQVEFLGETVPSGVDARLPQIRDLLLTLLTSKTFDQIRTPEGKQELREEIIARLNQVLDRDAVKAVYFTEFIVQ